MNIIFLVLEFMDSDLKKVLNSVKEMELNQEHILVLIYQVLCAIKFLHSANVIHRDIKPANILVDENCNIKICDFGLARS